MQLSFGCIVDLGFLIWLKTCLRHLLFLWQFQLLLWMSQWRSFWLNAVSIYHRMFGWGERGKGGSSSTGSFAQGNWLRMSFLQKTYPSGWSGSVAKQFLVGMEIYWAPGNNFFKIVILGVRFFEQPCLHYMRGLFLECILWTNSSLWRDCIQSCRQLFKSHSRGGIPKRI